MCKLYMYTFYGYKLCSNKVEKNLNKMFKLSLVCGCN